MRPFSCVAVFSAGRSAGRASRCEWHGRLARQSAGPDQGPSAVTPVELGTYARPAITVGWTNAPPTALTQGPAFTSHNWAPRLSARNAISSSGLPRRKVHTTALAGAAPFEVTNGL